MKPGICLISLFLMFSSMSAQPWMKLIDKEKKQSSKLNFYEIQRAFHQYWSAKVVSGKLPIKGKGYKQFKRWEEFMIPRVYPTGEFPSNQVWHEFQKEKKKSVQKNAPVSNWSFIGPVNVPLDKNNKPSGLGRINCVAFHPGDTNIIYAGAPSGGFWKTIDGGSNWFTTTDELLSIGISDIAIVPSNPDIIYIATGDGDAKDTYSIGVLKSVDGGISWMVTGLNWDVSQNLNTRKILVNSLNSNIILAATSQGIYRSINAGVSWTNVKSGIFKDLEFKPSDPSVVYAARYGSNSARFYKSTNSGASFSEIATGVQITETYRLELAVSGSSYSDIIYAIYSERDQNGFHSIWKSANSGQNWTKMYDHNGINLLSWKSDGSDIGGQADYDLSLAVSATDPNEIYVGGINIWKSANSGSSWNIVGHYSGDNAPYVHADHHHLVFSPVGVLFNGNDGGLYKTVNGGSSWSDISNGLQILQIDRIGNSQTADDIIMVGNQDNGTMKYQAATDSWTQLYGGDGAECIVDYTNSNIIYVSHIRGDILRSDNGGTSFTPIKPPTAGEGAWHTPLIIHPNLHETLYAGYIDVWQTNDRGVTWQKISNNLSPSKPLIQMAIAESNTNYLYVTNGTEIWRTKSGGTTWDNIPGIELSGLYISYITIDNNNPERIWITVSGYTNGAKVFHSDDAGSSWYEYSEGLPNVPANCIARQENSNDALFLGTDIGVYYRDASLTTWIQYSNGLPNVVVSELEIQRLTNKLRAGTRGRGLWQTTIEPIKVPQPPLALSVQTNSDGTRVEIIFNKEMVNPTGKQNEFVVHVGADIVPSLINLKSGSDSIYVLHLPSAISSGQVAKVTYLQGSVSSVDDGVLATFVNKNIRNNVETTVVNTDDSNEIKVYPNPNTGQFEVEFLNVQAEQALIKIVSVNGQIVYLEEIEVRKNFKYPVNMSGKSKGIYNFIVETGGEKFQKIIIVQ